MSVTTSTKARTPQRKIDGANECAESKAFAAKCNQI